MLEVNFLAVLLAAVSAFLLGGLWYSPALFGPAWLAESKADKQKGHPAKVYGFSFVLAFAAAWVFAWLAGPEPGPGRGVTVGVAAGAGIALTSFGINHLFAQRSFRLWLIDGGYHAVQFTLYGLVVGLLG
jgi:hypothetical protein